MHAPTSTTDTTTGPTAPPSVPPASPPSRGRRWWVAFGVATGVLGAGIAGVTLIESPYATLAPGKARSTVPLITIDGVETFPPDGDIFFLTVGVDVDVNLFEAATGWIDPDVDVFHEETILGPGVSEEENRRRNALAMLDSQDAAAVVALTRLGYELQPFGTGAVILEVLDDSPAEDALLVSDVITAFDGTPVAASEELGDLVRSHEPGDTVTITVEEFGGGATRDETVTLAEHPEEAGVAFLGVSSQTRLDPGLPFEVDIDAGSVGGPSAGLAFTLALIDVLSEGDLTGGRHVAVTGRIDVDGTVGTVGGVRQKAAAAAAAGAEVFILQADQVDDLGGRDHGMEIVPVRTLDDALAALERLGGDPVP